MKKVVAISFGLILLYLLLRNTDAYVAIYKRITDEFSKTFKAATFVENF